MGKMNSHDKGHHDAAQDSKRDSTERASNSILESFTSGRYYQPPTDPEEKARYDKAYRDEKNSK